MIVAFLFMFGALCLSTVIKLSMHERRLLPPQARVVRRRRRP